MKALPFLAATVLLGSVLTLSAQDPKPAPTEKPAPPEKKPPTPPPSTPETPKPPVKKPVPPKPKPKKYKIQSGDNPWTIAKEHGVDHAELLRINEIEDPKNMKIGDVIILPEGAVSKNPPKKAEPKQAAAPTPQSGDGWEMYTIQKGDNPWSIAKKLNLDHQKIMSLNEGLDFRDLKIGQQIKIPKKS